MVVLKVEDHLTFPAPMWQNNVKVAFPEVKCQKGTGCERLRMHLVPTDIPKFCYQAGATGWSGDGGLQCNWERLCFFGSITVDPKHVWGAVQLLQLLHCGWYS